jgi:uncharacterized membrane protein
MKKELLYAFTCLAFCTIIGGAVYEHINVVPVWAAAPPVSLSMFQGQYGMKQEYFWKFIHPVNLLLFIVTLAVHWRSPRKKSILTVLGGYVVILGITSIYFVPELIQITTTAFSNATDTSLTSRAALWEILSLVRLAVLIVLSLILFMGLTKPARHAFTAQ